MTDSTGGTKIPILTHFASSVIGLKHPIFSVAGAVLKWVNLPRSSDLREPVSWGANAGPRYQTYPNHKRRLSPSIYTSYRVCPDCWTTIPRVLVYSRVILASCSKCDLNHAAWRREVAKPGEVPVGPGKSPILLDPCRSLCRISSGLVGAVWPTRNTRAVGAFVPSESPLAWSGTVVSITATEIGSTGAVVWFFRRLGQVSGRWRTPQR